MATTLTLGTLWQKMGLQMGMTPTGTFTNNPGASVQDTNRFDADQSLNGLYLMDTTQGTYPITRVNVWSLNSGAAQTFTFYANLSAGASGDSYLLAPGGLDFQRLLQAVNSGVSLIGQSLHQTVRDESQTAQSNTYQYTINTVAGSSNSFFPRGVSQTWIQWDNGIPSDAYLPVPDFDWLDDTTIQMPNWAIDGYTGNIIRFLGYGPLSSPISSVNPSTVICTCDDGMVQAITLYCTSEAWGLIAAQKTSGEGSFESQQQQVTLQQAQALRKNWTRAPAMSMPVISPGQGF